MLDTRYSMVEIYSPLKIMGVGYCLKINTRCGLYNFGIIETAHRPVSTVGTARRASPSLYDTLYPNNIFSFILLKIFRMFKSFTP